MAIAAPGILLQGPVGTGKTFGAASLVEAGIDTRFLMLEPFADVLLKFEQDRGIPPCTEPGDGARLHYRVISPANQGWDVMLKNAQTIQTMNFEALSKLKAGLNNNEYGQFVDVLKSLSNYTCDRCGQSFGPVDNWGTDTGLVVDGMSSLATMAMDLVVGAKPTKAMGEWGVAMDNLERLVQKLATDLRCWFILLAHIEREVDEVNGGIKLMTSTLGKKLAPRIPRFFHEVILAQRTGEEFSWSNADPAVDLKNKLLPLNGKLPASMVPLVEAWKDMARQQGALPEQIREAAAS